MRLTEAFRALDALNEDTFSFSEDGIKKLAEFEQNDDSMDELSIIDLEAETEEDFEDSYIGKIIVDCCVCHSKIYKNKEDLEIDEESGLTNVGEECPYCYTPDGFKIVGEVVAYSENVTTEEDDDKEDNDDVKSDDDIEDTDDEEEINEGIFSKKKKPTQQQPKTKREEKWEVFDQWHKWSVGEYDTKAEAEKAAASRGDDGRYRVQLVTKSLKESKSINEVAEVNKEDMIKAINLICNGRHSYREKLDSYLQYRRAEAIENLSDRHLRDFYNEVRDELKQEENPNFRLAQAFHLDESKSIRENEDEEKLTAGKLTRLVKNITGLNTLKTQSTSVKGFHSIGEGSFKVTKEGYDNFRIIFYRDKDMQKKVKDELLSKGYTVTDMGNDIVVDAYKSQNESKSINESSDSGYWYFTRHGVQPGSIPKGANVLTIQDVENGTYVKLDRVLTTKELNDYEIIEKRPEGLDESKSINEGHQVQTYKGYELDWNEDDIDPEEGTANFDVYITKDGKTITNNAFNGFRAAREYIDRLRDNCWDYIWNVTQSDATNDEYIDSNNYEDAVADLIADIIGLPNGSYIGDFNDSCLQTSEQVEKLPEIYKAVKQFAKNHNIKVSTNESKSIRESVNNVNVETDDSIVNVSSDENGKVTVTTEPVDNVDIGSDTGEMVAPISPETENEIMNTSTSDEDSIDVEEPTEGEEVDLDIDEIDEESFDDLGEQYFKENYENVKSFKTVSVKELQEGLLVEGTLTFDSGNVKKTSFVFESKNVDKNNNVTFLVENKEMNTGKSFTVNGNVKDKKLFFESLDYKYATRDSKGNINKVSGTVKRG